MEKVGIYVHIPFCKQKCKYCDFVSFKCDNKKFDEYFYALNQEINEKAKELKADELDSEKVQNIVIDTVYIGGGTPSIVPDEFIEQVLNNIYSKFNVMENAEITIEVNPGTVNKAKLKKYYDIGINRLSIGLQSANDKLLNMLGRIHTFREFENVYEQAREVGFNNINVDLMIGLPKQSIEDVKDTLECIVKKSPEHISVYSLIIEENTQMYDLIENGNLKLPDEELEREMYWKVKNTLKDYGYEHYEISNFSKPGYESKHNMNCWKQHSYLGFGVAAHSYYDGLRYSNISNLKEYIDNLKNSQSIYNVVFHEKQAKQDMMKEFMLLGLRKIDGVKISEFKEKFIENPLYVFRNQLNKLVNDLANLVWMEFV